MERPEGRGGGIIDGKIGLKITVIITIETSNWMCCRGKGEGVA